MASTSWRRWVPSQPRRASPSSSSLLRRSRPRSARSSTAAWRACWERRALTGNDSSPKSGGPWAAHPRWHDMATILIVEDNATNMKLSSFLLESADYNVLMATTAEIGVAIARDQRPDLILMDIQLPGMDGLQATALLKADQV